MTIGVKMAVFEHFEKKHSLGHINNFWNFEKLNEPRVEIMSLNNVSENSEGRRPWNKTVLLQ